MKRSEINAAIARAINSARSSKVSLPLWADWTHDRFGENADGIRRQKLGWKVIDFGKGDFANCGLVLLVVSSPIVDNAGEPLRQSLQDGNRIYPVPGFSRKFLFVQRGQVEPNHYHVAKARKDVTVLAGTVRFQLFWANESHEMTAQEVSVQVDGLWQQVEAGGQVVLQPGQTITLPSYLSHVIDASTSEIDVILLEVSTANNDNNDNYFPDFTPTASAIEEDEAAVFYLLDEQHSLVELAE